MGDRLDAAAAAAAGRVVMKLTLALLLVVVPASSLVVAPPRRRCLYTRPATATSIHQRRALMTTYSRINSGNDNDDSRNNDEERQRKVGITLSSKNTNSSRRRQKKQPTSTTAAAADNPLAMIYRLYVNYLRRLWSETDVDHRRSVARRRARDAITNVKDLVTGGGDKHSGGEYDDTADSIFANLDAHVIHQMEKACTLMLAQLDAENIISGAKDDDSSNTVTKKTEKNDDKQSSISPAFLNAGSNNLPILNERGELVSYAAATAAERTVIATTSLLESGRRPTISIVADKTELTEALLAETAAVVIHDGASSSSTTITTTTKSSSLMINKKKKTSGGGNSRSVLFGATMGLVVAGWVYSGNYVFTALFTLMTALGQLEYYRMVMNTGIYPARKISVVGACAMFVTASFAPDLHQICLPIASTWAMIWFLTMRRTVSTISEIATTFTGIFYLGYIPSFWVRIRQIGADSVEPTRLAPLVRPILDKLGLQKNLPAFIPKTIKFPITIGANFIFWTWLCIAFSDVGGYFTGRRYGKTKLGVISPAAGKTSPNKTIEGVVGGCIVSAVLATLGAWVQQWPYWLITGPIHGVLLALLGLVGDLTASMLKRDAGLKDFGDLIPEHGGIMDRVDSYIFTAPYGWIVCGYVIPWLRLIASGGASAAKTMIV